MVDWYELEEEHKKISFQYNNDTIVGEINSYFDGEDDEPEERTHPFFALDSSHSVLSTYYVDEVSNVKILD